MSHFPDLESAFISIMPRILHPYCRSYLQFFRQFAERIFPAIESQYPAFLSVVLHKTSAAIGIRRIAHR